ncbi:glycoside hydrolase family 37 protein [Hypholoma sublateritium FD-334 SS-4]|uniref:Trehalase n=1 Tax=Hypholoma sublateritium (strain FD-334 SS-4) TaxID=945553 RepID=A0A0D2PAS7_HYPSF|nr:glycoside hydrolase family 37 protein [Hypholoma sublateritium FD-334 SS-4]
MVLKFSTICLLLQALALQPLPAVAIPQSASDSSSSSTTSTTATAPAGVDTSPPTLTIITSVPSATAALGSDLPSQESLPPKQAWCPSEIFCAGSVLQTVGIANLYPDDKTFVDKPTSKNASGVLADFQNISSPATYGAIVNFVDADFTGEGTELEGAILPGFNANPPFLDNVTETLPKAFAQTVNGFWTQLARTTNSSTLCGSSGKCESTLIPLNHTFVVPGGRFREIYYWDSFWIIEGLLESQLFSIANDTLQNFMDQLDQFGFIPNGGRIYYLNRSQPPLFIQMLSRYVQATNDTSILTRALPLAEKELDWWTSNRSVQVTSPFSNQTFTMFHYAVNNTAPRPESYLTDYLTANDPTLSPALNETQKEDLYAELASGAETGWDYTARWLHASQINAGLSALNVRNTIAVDLNSLHYKNHVALAELYGSSNASAVARHNTAAASLKAGILDLCWDSQKLAFYDFILDTNSRNTIFSVAAFYPFWVGIIPPQVLSNATAAFQVFSSVNMVLNRYNGTFPSTFIQTGLQWDAPNTWPNHQYIILNALQALPANLTNGPIPSPASGQSTFTLIPEGQLGLNETSLPGQPLRGGASLINATLTGPGADFNGGNGTVANGGNPIDGEGWGAALQRMLANRYFSSALCSWQATGGSIPNVLPRLSDAELNVTQSQTNDGNMFEKFSILDIDSAGSGGEYTVQAGFGWTNGVVLWVASHYGMVLASPQCPSLLAAPMVTGSGGSGAQPTSGAAPPKKFGGAILSMSLLVGAVAMQYLL